jgi:hypothetical protein
MQLTSTALGSALKLCLFHLAQSFWRMAGEKMGQLMRDPRLRRIIRLFAMLSHLPQREVIRGFGIILREIKALIDSHDERVAEDERRQVEFTGPEEDRPEPTMIISAEDIPRVKGSALGHLGEEGHCNHLSFSIRSISLGQLHRTVSTIRLPALGSCLENRGDATDHQQWN